VAGKLGSTVTHVLQSHSMLHMTKVIAHCSRGKLVSPTVECQG